MVEEFPLTNPKGHQWNQGEACIRSVVDKQTSTVVQTSVAL